MRFMYDTEFHEDGKTIDFISIGIVAEDGREYYAVSSEFDTWRVAENDWLMENVMPSIGHESYVVANAEGFKLERGLFITDKDAKPRKAIATDIYNFIKDDPDPQFWAWHSAYDHVCLAQLFGRMIDLPKPMPMFTNDIMTLVKEVKRKKGKGPVMPKQPEGKHNALADARFNVVRYNYLRDILDA